VKWNKGRVKNKLIMLKDLTDRCDAERKFFLAKKTIAFKGRRLCQDQMLLLQLTCQHEFHRTRTE
jgi:hypothetical protein